MGLCQNCHVYKKMGKACWYHWADKKTCSQFKESEEEDPKVKSEENIKS